MMSGDEYGMGTWMWGIADTLPTPLWLVLRLQPMKWLQKVHYCHRILRTRLKRQYYIVTRRETNVVICNLGENYPYFVIMYPSFVKLSLNPYYLPIQPPI